MGPCDIGGRESSLPRIVPPARKAMRLFILVLISFIIGQGGVRVALLHDDVDYDPNVVKHTIKGSDEAGPVRCNREHPPENKALGNMRQCLGNEIMATERHPEPGSRGPRAVGSG